MSVFDNLGILIGDAQLAVTTFEEEVAKLSPLLEYEVEESEEPINIDDYIRNIVAEYFPEVEEGEEPVNIDDYIRNIIIEYLSEETETIVPPTSTPSPKRHTGHQNNDKGEESAPKTPSMEDNTGQIKVEDDNLNQLQAEITSLKKQIMLLEQLPLKVAMLPDKADIIAIVREQINESNRYHNADNPKFMDEAHSAPKKYG